MHNLCTPRAAHTRALRQSSEMSSGAERDRNRTFHEAAAELALLSRDIRASLCSQELSENSQRHLETVLKRIERAAELLRATGRCRERIDFENPAQELSNCSKTRCERAAAAIVNGHLFCGEHASEALRDRAQPAANFLARRHI